MLQITIDGAECWDEVNEEFVYLKPYTLNLEHSLISLSKWEARWNKPFLSTKELSFEESIDYIKCMTLNPNTPDDIYMRLTQKDISTITDYLSLPMTATWFSEDKTESKKGPKEVVTAEIIYYWMIALNIPPEYKKWHLNRLLTLIRVCNEKNKPAKPMSRKELMNRNRELNAARKKKYKTKG